MNAALDIAGLPKGVVSDIMKFKTHYVVVVVAKALIDGTRAFCLPGSMALIDNKNNQFNIFGIKTPELNVAVILDKTIDPTIGITKEDLEYFKNLDDFEIVCNLRNWTFDSAEEIFRPIDSLINSEPVTSNDSVVEFKSAVNGKSIFVRKGSNRHKFIKGESDFFEDPFDFLATKDSTIRLDMIEHYASSKNFSSYYYMFDKLQTNTLGTCLTIFSNDNMRDIAKKAIEIRSRIESPFSEDEYWDFEEGTPRISSYKNIEWDNFEKALSVAKDNEKSFNECIKFLAVEAEPASWGPYTVHIFFMFYMLLEQDKVDFVKSSFNL
jgi:hypothetical protein